MAKSRERSCCWADRRGSRALVGVGERERETGDTPSLGEPVADHTAYSGTLNTSNYGRKTSNTRISSVKGWLYCLGHTPVK